MTTITTQDIFATDPTNTSVITVIGHGVNVFGTMGAGFAALVARRWPKVRDEYHAACMVKELTVGHTHFAAAEDLIVVANIASQDYPGPYARVDWLQSGLREMYEGAKADSPLPFTVRVPLIGAGYGGLDPLVAAQTIIGVAAEHPDIPTSLYLLPSDAHTSAVIEKFGKGQQP